MIQHPSPLTVEDRLDVAGEIWRRCLAYAAMASAPIIAFVGMQGFAALLGLAGIGSLVFLGRTSSPNPGVAILLGLVLWALISMGWSEAMPLRPNFHSYHDVEAMTGLKLVFQLPLYAAFVLAMRRLDEPTAARGSLILACALVGLTALQSIEFFDGTSVYQGIKAAAHQRPRLDLAFRNVARGCYLVTVLFWPAALRLLRANLPVLVAFLGAGLGFTAVAYNVDAPILALILSGVAFAVVRFFGRIAVFGLALASVLYLGAAPVIGLLAGSVLSPDQSVLAIAKQSWSARVAIWRFVATKICEAPLFGWGLDASRSWPESIPMHPHNAALQIWLELGALGVILTALFWVWLFTKVADIATSDKTMAAAAAASAVAYLTIGALSFGVWQEWWLAVGALVIVFCGFVAATRRRDFSEGFAPNTLRPV